MGQKATLSTLYPEYKIYELIENLSRELKLSMSIIDFLENKHIYYPSEEKNNKQERELKRIY